ncbi:MAG: hypothetical protein DRG87_11870 [Deltaproteobacteria bacterium]|nr:MAG: hypothetical protein DRG87_11870 [Deltaproteobacteria bacterium]
MKNTLIQVLMFRILRSNPFSAGKRSCIPLALLPSWCCHLAIALLCLSVPLACFASEPMTVPTQHFAFSFHAQDDRTIRGLIDEAEELRREIVTDLGLEAEGVTRVYLASSLNMYQALQPGGKIQAWSAAVAYPRQNLIIMLSPRAIKQGHMELSTIFKHEFTHIALGRAFQGSEGIPHWLHEGVAMYESREWDFRRVSAIMRAVLTDTLIPLSEITQRFPQEKNRAELAYCQSFYLISFLINEYGRPQFHRFIREYSLGTPLNRVLVDIYGMSLDQLEEQWRRHLKMRFSWIPIITSATALWFLLALLFILAYGKKRGTKRQLYEQWDKEELIGE